MKLIFCDLDDTLLVLGTIPEANIAAVRKAREAGHKFIICTGRPAFMTDAVQDALGLRDAEGEYSVCLNGGFIMENRGCRALKSGGLSRETISDILKVAEHENICAMVAGERNMHLFNPLPSEIQRKRQQHIEPVLHSGYDLDEIKDEAVFKILLISDNGDAPLKALYAGLPEELRESCTVTFSSNRFMEFIPKGTNKGSAVHFLADYLGVDIRDTIAIGDSCNDVEMLLEAGTGICVKGADKEARDVADIQCEKTCLEGAVAEGIEKYVL